MQGDLDLGTSKHHLTTLKASYTKLQFLIDRGCVFVGHGLANDFKLINLVVPPGQVVDTVELFSLPRQRNLSLRFLTARLLGKEIQTDSHNSIEDAQAALRLYEVYRSLVEEGSFESTLAELYQYGKAHGWTGGGAGGAPSSPTRLPGGPLREGPSSPSGGAAADGNKGGPSQAA